MPDRPNVVLVLCDQLRRQALSCAGDPNVSTPNVDSLAEEGARFENACSTYPICVPTRFSLLTGEHAHTRSVPGIDYKLSRSERTLADEFSAAGYDTAWIGKWHLAAPNPYRDADHETSRYLNRQPIQPADQGGFDHWRGFELRNDPFDTAYFADDDPEPRAIEGYQTDGLFELGFEFLEDQTDREGPFFLVISVEPPHPPFLAPEEDADRWTDRSLDLRPNVPYGDPDGLPAAYDEWGSTERARDDLTRHSYYDGRLLDDLRSYYATIENLDQNVGRLLDRLEARGQRDRTVTTFVSDHGELLGSHGLTAKQHPYEESVGVPFVVDGPEVDGGRVLEPPTCTEDWFPTLLGLAGVEPTTDPPGTNLAPLLRGETETLDREGVLLEFVREDRSGQPYHDETWRAFRTARYKYTVKGGPGGATPWQLFDLQEDPYERTNLIGDADHEAVARELHGHLRDALDRTDDGYDLQPAYGYDVY
jgi:arylsulfatase A-like enzyme